MIATLRVGVVFGLLLGLAASSVAQVSASDQEAAKAHFLAGSSYYEAANYSDAVKEFNEAYRLSKRPDLLYNIALGYERLTDYDNAIATLRRYLVEKVNAPDRNIIESRIKNLEKLRDAKNAPPTPPTPTPTPEPPQPKAKRSLGVLGYTGAGLTGLGGALLLSSIGTGVAAKNKADYLAQQCPTRVNCDPSLRDDQQKGRKLAVATDALIGIGAVAAVTGIVLIIVDLVRKPKVETKPAPTPLPPSEQPMQPSPDSPLAPPPTSTPPAPSVSFTGNGLSVHF